MGKGLGSLGLGKNTRRESLRRSAILNRSFKDFTCPPQKNVGGKITFFWGGGGAVPSVVKRPSVVVFWGGDVSLFDIRKCSKLQTCHGATNPSLVN